MIGDRSVSAFADESSLDDRYMGFGAVILPTQHLARAEAMLEEFCSARGFRDREMAWKKCSASKAARYEEFMALFWTLVETLPAIDFRTIVLDRVRSPLKAHQYMAMTEEEGFYRFYHSFLTRSLAAVASDATGYQLHIAMTPDRYPHRTEILQKTVGGTIGRAAARTWQIVQIVRGVPKSYRVHQLADVLLGSIMYRLNDRGPDSHKLALVEALERRLGRRVDQDFMPHERPFNIWFFTRRGDPRWAPGSVGRV